MEKRLLLAITLSVLVLLLYNLYFYKEAEKRQKLYKKVPKKEEISPVSTSPFPKVVPITPIDKKSSLKINTEELTIRTNMMKIKLNEAGEINSWKLYKFKEKDNELVELIQPTDNYPLKVLLGDKEFTATDFSTIGRVKEFVYTNIDIPQVQIIKQFSYHPDSYALDVHLKVVNNSEIALKNKELTLQWVSPPNPRYGTAAHSTIINQICFIDGKMKKIAHKASGILDGILSAIRLIPPVQPEDSVRIEQGKIGWIAHESQYFLNILLSNEFVEEAIFTKKINGQQMMTLVIPKIDILPAQTHSFKFKVYGGPKDMDILKSLSFGAEQLTGIDVLSGVVHWILKKLYNITNNYGLSIILLTFIIKIILHPLTRKNFIVMKDMQKKMKMIQPELEKLKEKHKNDKESLNREMMELYKRYKVNPLGGCLPLLLQMPVFFALFTTLQKSIELRGASFLIWRDLSSPDPLFILPILMGVTMFIQQKMTPTPDPTQAKIGQIMTIFFTFIFITFPVGLVLYWLIQNILTIVEQYLINKGIEK